MEILDEKCRLILTILNSEAREATNNDNPRLNHFHNRSQITSLYEIYA